MPLTRRNFYRQTMQDSHHWLRFWVISLSIPNQQQSSSLAPQPEGRKAPTEGKIEANLFILGQVYVVRVEATERLRPKHDDTPYHCPPSVPTKLQQCFKAICGRFKKVAYDLQRRSSFVVVKNTRNGGTVNHPPTVSAFFAQRRVPRNTKPLRKKQNVPDLFHSLSSKRDGEG